jgi:hypothetical protein
MGSDDSAGSSSNSFEEDSSVFCQFGSCRASDEFGDVFSLLGFCFFLLIDLAVARQASLMGYISITAGSS